MLNITLGIVTVYLGILIKGLNRQGGILPRHGSKLQRHGNKLPRHVTMLTRHYNKLTICVSRPPIHD
jgi:hypothetical protein